MNTFIHRSKAEVHLHKQLITALIAVSLPLALSAGQAMPATAGEQTIMIAAADPNAGASADGSGQSDSSDAASSQATAPSRDATGGGESGAGGSDASLDSMWNENPAPAAKSKPKRKGFFKSHSAKVKESAGADATGAVAPSGSDSGKSSATGNSDLAPAPAASPATSSSPSQTDANTQPAASSGSADFGYSSDQPAKSTSAPAASTPDTNAIPVKAERPGTATAGGETQTSPATTSPAPAFRRSEEIVHSAPLCTTHTFFQSELVRSVSWPGVGPFKGDTDPNDLADPQENKLSLQTEGDKLTSAELFLQHQPNSPQGFINLQMVMDFMLEALGARDKKINDFNTFLEKHKEKITRHEATETKPLTTTNGPYLISIASSAPSAKEPSFLIQIKSKNASAELLRSHSEVTGRALEEPPAVRTTGQGDRPNAAADNHNVIATAASVPPSRKPADTTKAKVTKPPAPAETTKPEVSKQDSLKQEFADTIRTWQSIKKVAVRTQDTAELSKVLSGKALDKQTVAIGWLVKKKDYYDMTPKGVVVDRFEELSQSPGRYAVYAQVKEMSKLMDQTTGKQLSESDDQYNVKYTIEKSGDHWSICDSELVKSGGQTANQSKGKTRPKH